MIVWAFCKSPDSRAVACGLQQWLMLESFSPSGRMSALWFMAAMCRFGHWLMGTSNLTICMCYFGQWCIFYDVPQWAYHAVFPFLLCLQSCCLYFSAMVSARGTLVLAFSLGAGIATWVFSNMLQWICCHPGHTLSMWSFGQWCDVVQWAY